jgi:hypothetical protein
MKKRSLFAAVAMLIVSALVLTSATYAWFNVGGDAYVQATRGSVMKAGTGVRLKTDKPNFDWNSELLPQDFDYTGTNNNHFVQKWSIDTNGDYTQTLPSNNAGEAFYAPMSVAPSMAPANLTFRMFDIAGDNSFAVSTRDPNVANYYDVYEFYVGTTIADPNGSDIDAIFTLGTDTWDNSSTSALAAARALVYVSSDNGTTWSAVTGADIRNLPSGKTTDATTPIVFAGSNEGAYMAVSDDLSTTDKIYDNGGNTASPSRNYIMNDETSSGAGNGDTGYSANSGNFTEVAANQIVNATGGVQIKLSGVNNTDGAVNERTMIRVYVWIEGQDANCAPAIGGGHLTTAWQCQYKNPTA